MDQHEYETYKDEVLKWLDNANKIMNKCDSIQKLDDINSNLNEINVSIFLSRKFIIYFLHQKLLKS